LVRITINQYKDKEHNISINKVESEVL